MSHSSASSLIERRREHLFPVLNSTQIAIARRFEFELDDDRPVRASTIVIASGARYRKLNLACRNISSIASGRCPTSRFTPTPNS
jgi:thioredoxin reductase